MRSTTFFAGLLAAVACSTNLLATELVVPGPASATIEGGSANTIPFGPDFDFGFDYQQVWAGSAFGTEPRKITAISWRRDGAFDDSMFGTFNALSYTMTLSTTSAVPGGLSLTFGDNEGADATVVYSGPATIEFTGAPGAPNDFGTLALQTPFDYDPTAGNLLMEISYVGVASGIGSVDAYTDAEASGVTSRVFDSAFGPPIASTEFSAVVQFTLVPEPASIAACVVALAACGLRRRV